MPDKLLFVHVLLSSISGTQLLLFFVVVGVVCFCFVLFCCFFLFFFCFFLCVCFFVVVVFIFRILCGTKKKNQY